MRLAEAVYARLPASLQAEMISLLGARLKRRRFGTTYQEATALLRQIEASDPELGQAVQKGYLQETIRRAVRDVPYYRDLFRTLSLKAEDIRTVDDLGQLPILTKQAVRENRERLLSEQYAKKDLIYAHTSGSTGAGLKLFWDANVDAWTNAVLWRQREWAGVPFGVPYGTLFGRVIHPRARTQPPFWRWNRSWKQLILSSFHLAPANLDAYVEAIQRYGLQALEAYPSAVATIAQHLVAQGRTVPLKAVFTTSETLMDEQREAIETAFACPCFDFFAAAERGIFAADCEKHEGFHLFDAYGATEVVDAAGDSVPGDESGRLVLTTLHNHAMPLIRYESGDISGFQDRSCSCGRPLRLLNRITTKREDLIRLPGGEQVPPSAITHAFKPIECIVRSQVVQETLHSVVVTVVPGTGYSAAAAEQIREALESRLGSDVVVTVRTASEIPLGPRGKFRWVISKVAQPA